MKRNSFNIDNIRNRNPKKGKPIRKENGKQQRKQENERIERNPNEYDGR